MTCQMLDVRYSDFFYFRLLSLQSSSPSQCRSRKSSKQRIGKLLRVRGECLLIVSLCPNKLLWETLVLGVINFVVLR